LSKSAVKQTIRTDAVADPEGTRPLVAAPASSDGRDIRARTPYLLRQVAGREAHRRIGRVVVLFGIDVAGIWGAIFSALAVKGLVLGEFDADMVIDGTFDLFAFAALVTVLLFARVGLYDPRPSRPGYARTIACLIQATVVSLIFALVSGTEFSTYWLFFGGLIFASVYVGGGRWLFELVSGGLLDAVGYRRRAVLVGTSRRIHAVAETLEDSPAARYEPVGFFALDQSEPNGLRDLGHLDRLSDLIIEASIEEVIITDSDFPQDRATDVISKCHLHGVRVRIAPSTTDVLTQRSDPVLGEGVPLLEVKPPVFEGFDFVVKRVFDFFLAVLLLIVASPLLVLTALAVKLTSRGPVLHQNLRPGIGGKPFGCLKFRTMYEDAEQRQATLEPLNEASGAIFKIRDDPRLTRVGSFLRRNSIDELPQLLNVLRGEMSLVGPRPLPLRDHARLEDWHRRRYLVLPGVTGLWQVSGRSNLDFDDMVRLDFMYLERWSVLLDLVILLKTVPAVVRRRGAW